MGNQAGDTAARGLQNYLKQLVSVMYLSPQEEEGHTRDIF